jgi:hypothetical protein
VGVETKVTGLKETKQRLITFPAYVGRKLKPVLGAWAVTVRGETENNFGAMGLHRRSGTMLDSLRTKVWAGAKSAGLRVAFGPDAFYSSWIEYGLPLRPVHERARSRRGIVNSRIGRSYESRKPWGLKGWPVLTTALKQNQPNIESAAFDVLEQAKQDFTEGKM